jgi:flagellar motility protein MotE (MotC chaperone)
MNPADEMAAKTVTAESQSAGAVAGSNDQIEEQLRATLKELQRNQSKLAEDLQSHLLRISHHLDYETSERKAVYDRLRAIDNQTKRTLESQAKRRGSRGFARYLVAICIGVAATLAWQSYGEAAKQVIATSAPELGW